MARKTIAIVSEISPSTTGGIVKLAPDFSVPEAALANVTSINVAQQSGTAGYVEITFAGTYVVGDQAKVTISSNLTSRQKFRKTYTVDVLAGATGTTAIAESLVAKIQREIDAGLIDYPFASVGNVAGVVTITQAGDDSHGLEAFVYTASAAGTIASAITDTVISEGQPSDLTDAGIPADKVVAANYATVLVPYNIQVAQPFIDSKGEVATHLKIFASAANYQSDLQTIINAI